MMASLRKNFPNEEKAFFEGLFKTPWVVHAKRPFGGPQQVIDYLEDILIKLRSAIIAYSPLQKMKSGSVIKTIATIKREKWRSLQWSSFAGLHSMCFPKASYVSGIMAFYPRAERRRIFLSSISN
jgi:hypothetical protein